MIVLKDITCGYGDVLPIKSFSCELPNEGVVLLLGASGSGKSTLLKLLNGLIRPVSGSIAGIEDKRVSTVFQENRLLSRLSAAKNVELVGAKGAEIGSFMALVELTEFSSKRAAELSGGQQRRVALARALHFGGDVLLLDEPFTGVDAAMKARIAERMRGMFALTVIATHEPEEAALLGEGPTIYL